MTDTNQITILSGLPVKTLETIRWSLNLTYAKDRTFEDCATICRLVNLALEEKQEDYYTQFEHVTDNNPLFT